MIEKIYHLADIHIRNYKRHKEYISVFKKVFSHIKKTKGPNDVIVVAGDLVHSKTDMSPELVKVLHFFLKGLADLLPTIVIPGNHDLNLNNTHRLDALTPVIDAIGHPNIHFWKDNKVYELNGVHFSHFSIFNNPSEWHLSNEFEADYKIALYHGPVQGAYTDINFKIANQVTTVDLFYGFDLGLLGDIHKRQFIDKENKIAYPGSLIQQNFGESVDKGFLVWDLGTKTSQFIHIDNPHKFITIEAKDNQVELPQCDLKNARVRIKYVNCDRSFITELETKLRSQHKIAEFTSLGVSKLNEANQFQLQAIGSIREVETQNSLIEDFLLKTETINTDDLTQILQLNKQINTSESLSSSEVRNVIWQPVKFEFSNMFSYGPNNSVDFSNIRGVYGIFAPNAGGKSTFLDSLTYCIFDKCSRTYRASHVLNNNKDQFKCKLHFKLNGKDYYIKRVGTKGKQNYLKGRVKVDVDFWMEDNGEVTMLNGADRDETNKIIRSYLGTYEDFILTALSTQNDNQSFVDKSQKDRKELLYNFLDISVFDHLYQTAKDNAKENEIRLKDLSSIDYDTEISNIQDRIDDIRVDEQKLTDILNQGKDTKKQLQQQLQSLFKQIKPINLQHTDISEIQSNIQKYTNQLNTLRQEGEQTIKQQQELTQQVNQLDHDINQVDAQQFDSVEDDVAQVNGKIASIKLQLTKLTAKVDHHNTLISKLHDHKYDPNCEYCVSNEFVQHALAAKDELPQLQHQIEQLHQQQHSYDTQYQLLDRIIHNMNHYLSLTTRRSSLHHQLDKVVERRSYIVNQYNQTVDLKNHWENIESQYHDNEQIIKHNNVIQQQIDEVNDKIHEIDSQIEQLYHKIGQCKTDTNTLQYRIDDLLQKLKSKWELVDQQRILQYYLKAVSRDGVPYVLLTETLPALQNEVNRILNQIVDFSIKLEADDKNHINAYIVYNEVNHDGENKGWPIELTSGMERFMISTAIRSALVNITTLPRPNFLAIDEGFGVLDGDKLNSVGFLFDYLKTQYSFLLCISHIDSMRDNMEGLLDIKKVNGYSKISA